MSRQAGPCRSCRTLAAMINKVISRSLILLLACLFLVPIAYLIFVVMELRLQPAPMDNGVRFDVQWLGEYETSLTSITIRGEDNDAVLWQAVASDGEMRVRTFSIFPGVNPRVLPGLESSSGVSIVVPTGDPQFSLEPGRRYIIEVAASTILGRLCVPRISCRAVALQF